MRPGGSPARWAFAVPGPAPFEYMVRAKDAVADGTPMCLLAVEIFSTIAAFRSSMDV
jgi:hypothetical protein